MRKILGLIFFLFCNNLYSQSTLNGVLKGLKLGDTAIISIQKSSELYYFKKLAGTGSDINYSFLNLSNGKWAMKIDATGYYYPGTTTIDLQNQTKQVTYSLVPITLQNSVDYEYSWQDDSSYIGHAQQSYINDEEEIVFGDRKIKIPEDYNSLTLLYKHGIALSNEISEWSPEDSYRLFQIVKKVPGLTITQDALSTYIAPTNSVWKITNSEVIDDILIEEREGIKYVTLARSALLNSEPFIGYLDGIKGKYYSKRLHRAVVAFVTNYGRDKDKVNQIAKTRFGVEFLVPNLTLQNIMGEDFSNFQEFSATEKLIILSMLEELPDGMHIQTNLKYIVRRISGQDNPKYPAAAAIAWIGLNTIEFMGKAFLSSNISDVQRLVLHEKTHFLWAGLFDDRLKADWIKIGGWFIDPTASSGWTTPNTTEFVSAYAHANNPDEDMAETVATYVVNPDLLRSRSLRKFEFIRDRVMHGTRYISQIRKDLTFRVYNLYPDYNYPGKIRKIDVNVVGAPENDKVLTIRLYLTAIDSTLDGASSAYTRITSSAGTWYDIGFSKIDKYGFILEGKLNMSKFAKSGYWFVNQIVTVDPVGNQRFENNSNFGLKIFVNNPLEDLIPPKYIDKTMNLSLSTGKFSNLTTGENLAGETYQMLVSKFNVEEKNTMNYFGLNFAIPKNDELGVRQGLQFGVLGNNPEYVKRDSVNNSIQKVTYVYPIPEYFPTGYYVTTQLYMLDIAQNDSRAYFLDNPQNLAIYPPNTKHYRDSIYVKTKYPDFLPPKLDVNNIFIKATPTNPNAPDGETLFEMEFFVKDTSAYFTHEAGFNNGAYVLRDPQGKAFSFGTQQNFVRQFKKDILYDIEDIEGKPYEWRKYYVSTLLPKGSAPGIWGVESITLYDRAMNKKYYDFKEIVRFDLEEVDSSQKINPRVQILGKNVNAKNVENIGLSIACESCKDKRYRARIYSLMGGRSVVAEGIMSSDSVYIPSLNLKEVNDGILYATVYILDTSRVALGLGKAKYDKDTVIPKDYKLKTNYQNFGKANIDKFIIEIETREVKGESIIEVYPEVVQSNNIEGEKSYKFINLTVSSDRIIIKVANPGAALQIVENQIKNLPDGKYIIRYTVIDSVGNEGLPVYSSFIKDTVSPLISFTKTGNSSFEIYFDIEVTENTTSDLLQNQILTSNLTISKFEKISSTKYKLVVIPNCNGTIDLTLPANLLFDASLNTNLLTNYNGQTNKVGLPIGFNTATLSLSGIVVQSSDKKAMKIQTSENLGNNKIQNYTALQSIELQPGFVAEKGTVFRANIGAGCQ